MISKYCTISSFLLNLMKMKNINLFRFGVVYTFCSVFSFISCVPTCPPYTINVGINSTAGTTLKTIACTTITGTLAYSIDTSSDGYSYFAIDSSTGILSLANLLDVEYGPVTWTVNVIATDNAGTTTTVVTVNTYISTTTTTSTQPPPGYDWFDEAHNKYLFWSVMGFAAALTATCILLCVRYHRKGRCLPKSCPRYEQMIDSFNRQCKCCPIPCDFYTDKPEKEDEEEIKEYVDDTPWGLPLREPKLVTPSKASTPKKPSTPKSESTPKKKVKDKEPTLSESEADRSVVVTPLVIGNAHLEDVGFDGMRSPGFNAPMFTSYGGKKGSVPKKKY